MNVVEKAMNREAPAEWQEAQHPPLCNAFFHIATIGLGAFAATYNLCKAAYHNGSHLDTPDVLVAGAEGLSSGALVHVRTTALLR
ncbi:hypothetical protein SAMN04489727_4971 [Amycolatopsis tolypomycina]|uniref:Uncharacterized protein n=1 Tax=Amycolatopsis tolypomycina TaxID=208445 RepID=A0A1H4V4F6_9PSEU|nr:hypothetical protein [Amycolatopsis tolypomycina]SEC75837.1 hypothetical protein SAMN04489727_4971 [Amycolatopsis tolypomycina]